MNFFDYIFLSILDKPVASPRKKMPFEVTCSFVCGDHVFSRKVPCLRIIIGHDRIDESNVLTFWRLRIVSKFQD